MVRLPTGPARPAPSRLRFKNDEAVWAALTERRSGDEVNQLAKAAEFGRRLAITLTQIDDHLDWLRGPQHAERRTPASVAGFQLQPPPSLAKLVGFASTTKTIIDAVRTIASNGEDVALLVEVLKKHPNIESERAWRSEQQMMAGFATFVAEAEGWQPLTGPEMTALAIYLGTYRHADGLLGHQRGRKEKQADGQVVDMKDEDVSFDLVEGPDGHVTDDSAAEFGEKIDDRWKDTLANAKVNILPTLRKW